MSISTKLLSISGASEKYWVMKLTSTSYALTESVAVDSSGNVVTVGYYSEGGANRAFALMADSEGSILWANRVQSGSIRAAEFYDVAIDSNDNVICAGTAHNNVSNDAGALIVSYSNAGSTNWRFQYGNTANGYTAELTGGVAVDSDDNIYASGFANRAGHLGLFTKLNSSGTLQYWNNHQGDGQIYVNKPIEINATEMALASQDSSYGNWRCVSKSNGSVAHSTSYGPTAEFYDIAKVPSTSDSIALGVTENQGISGSWSALLMSFTENGVLNWQKYLGVSGTNFRGRDIAIDSEGNIIVVLAQDGVGTGYIVKLNSSATSIVWQKKINSISANRERGTGLEITPNDDICFSLVLGSNLNSSYLLKVPSDGEFAGTYSSLVISETTDVTLGTAAHSSISANNQTGSLSSYASLSDYSTGSASLATTLYDI